VTLKMHDLKMTAIYIFLKKKRLFKVFFIMSAEVSNNYMVNTAVYIKAVDVFPS